MQIVKKRKKKIGSLIYVVFLVLWILLLTVATFYLWKTVMRFGEYWEASQISPKVDAYIDRLSVEMWGGGENSVINTISEMDHPYQTDEECVEVLREILKDELRCVPASGSGGESTKVYDLLCGQSKFGQVNVSQEVFVPEENSILNWMIEKYSLYPWRVDGVQFYLDGLYSSFEITVPEEYTVLLNGHQLTSEQMIETGIPYNTLKEYYEEFDGLPTKVTYRADHIFGRVDYQLLDAHGEPTEIDPARDDSQFIEPVSQELVDRFDSFTPRFARRYLEFCAGTDDMWRLYLEVQPYVLKDSDLADRLYRMIDSYLGWQHNKNFNFNGATLNSVTALGNNNYVLDISAEAGSQMPAGYVTVHRDMKVYVRYFPNTDEVFAFSAEDYNTEES